MKGPTQVKNLLHVLFVTKHFQKKSKVKRHEGTHTGEKPFACSFCNKIFRENSKKEEAWKESHRWRTFCMFLLWKKIFRKVKHEMTHTGEKTLSISFMCHYVLFLFRFLPQKEHAKSFPPVWVLSCAFMSDFCVNVLPQKEHEKGFSPVWVPSCLFTFEFFLKIFLSQKEHSKGFFHLCGPFHVSLCMIFV